MTDELQPAQPNLFDDEQMPYGAAVLVSIQKKRYEHQGVKLAGNDVRAFRMVELLCLGWGIMKISREMHVSIHTVYAARRVLGENGKLAIHKQRVEQLFEEIIETGASNYLEALEKKLVPAVSIPVGIGIVFDKRQLTTNQAMSVNRTMDSGPTVESINAALENLSGAIIDSQSTGNHPKTTQNDGCLNVDASLDASLTPPTATQPDAPAVAIDHPLRSPVTSQPDPVIRTGPANWTTTGDQSPAVSISACPAGQPTLDDDGQ